MGKFTKFDMLESPLEGTSLIEASAGTGKTYTIASVFLRLLLEKWLSVDEILVVTFTESATEELKERILNKLRAAAKIFSGEGTEDVFLANLCIKHKDSKRALRHIMNSIRSFDLASIFTIHGFCMRVLTENTFESGGLFDTQLITDQGELKREVATDFWRTKFYHESPAFIRYLMYKKFSLDTLISLFSNRFSQLDMNIIPSSDNNNTLSPEEDYRLSFFNVSQNWKAGKEDIRDIILNSGSLNRRKYPESKLDAWIEKIDSIINLGPDTPALPDELERFTTTKLKEATKLKCTTPTHPFFDLCEDLFEKRTRLDQFFEKRIIALKAEFLCYAEDKLKEKKDRRNLQFFDDLLSRLYYALERKGGEKLAHSLRLKFKAALIDEFQDTDPVQYAIFKEIFGKEKGSLFLIGDPKQAIYGFRGADIFTYIHASRDVNTRYTLLENWRADAPLITAINTIFSGVQSPFIYDEIPFQKISAPGIHKAHGFTLRGKEQPPFTLWYVKSTDKQTPGKGISKKDAKELISKAIAAEISSLIHLGKKGEALIDGKPVHSGDIAVLVRKNEEARLLQQSLSELHIPSAIHSSGNIFDTHEAIEMKRLLDAVSQPNDLRLLRPALATDIIGVEAEKLDLMLDNEPGWENWLVAFKEYHEIWKKRGFIQMFRYLLGKENVLMRLMSFPDGERRNTNMLHLSEILQCVSSEKKLTMEGLLQWLSEHIASKDSGLEEHQLRLESDENAVKLITIHKSKGLEYPIVFCPFMWDGSRIKDSKQPVIFHDEGQDMKLTLDLGSQEIDKNRTFAEKQQLSENLRLFYVALTRAKNICYTIWGYFNQAETSAPAYLFHLDRPPEETNLIEYLGERFKGLNDDRIHKDLQDMADRSNGTIRIAEIPSASGEKPSPTSDKEQSFTFSWFSGTIDRSYRIASFSSLISNQGEEEEYKDYDSKTSSNLNAYIDAEGSGFEERVSDIFSFPKGARSGLFFHDLLEHTDFTESDHQIVKNTVREKLEEYGIDLSWEDIVYDMLTKLISAPLDPEHDSDLRLECIGKKERLHELQFYFPLKKISPNTLKNILSKYADTKATAAFPQYIDRLQFSPARGFMTGFIDMVFRFRERFYLVDWKSNLLGTSIKDYDQAALAKTMEEEYYTLQYQIYTVALNQYLSLRLPNYDYERDFGGILYIFLRGVDPKFGHEFGIYRKRPSKNFIKSLSEQLIDKSGMHED